MKYRLTSSALLGLAALALFPACSGKSTEAPTAITNSKYFLNDPASQISTPDPMLSFEQRQHMHGAITRDEQKEREGHYYTFSWSDSVRTPAVVRLEFRQENTGSLVKVKEQAVESPRRKNATDFQITGEEFAIDGKVSAWRVSIVRDGGVVASDQSYLW